MVRISRRTKTKMNGCKEVGKEKNYIPNDALKNNKLDHEGLSEITIHSIEKRDPHNQSVRQSSQRKESDDPIQPPAAAVAGEENSPKREQKQNKNLRESISQYKFGVHLKRVVLRNEVEG